MKQPLRSRRARHPRRSSLIGPVYSGKLNLTTSLLSLRLPRPAGAHCRLCSILGLLRGGKGAVQRPRLASRRQAKSHGVSREPVGQVSTLLNRV